MRALKLLVVAMGVLLVAGIAVVVVTIVSRVNHRAAPAIAAATIMAPNGEHRSVELPAGAAVISVQSDGDRVALRLKLAEGGEELVLLDWKTGARLATLDLTPGPTPPRP